MEWTRPTTTAAPATSLAAQWKRFTSDLFDWETVVTLLLALGAVTAVTVPLEDGGWRQDMPPLTTVSVIAVLAGMLLARSRTSALVAWPLGILTGAAVVVWQTLSMAGPGTLSDRVWNTYDRFDAWFGVINSSRVTNDPLPFNVLIISLTWLGVMLFVWSLYRWHNAWIGLIPGGAALFLDLTLVGDNLTGAIILYMLFGFLLVMQTNLLACVRQWRHEGTHYPPMINLTFLHFSLWALIILMMGAWLIPAGLKTPGPVESLAEDALQFASRYVRLAGPLQSNKVIPIHSYSGTLTFSGSIDLGSRDLMTVTVNDPHISGSLLLKGTTYDEYEGGGWQMSDRVSVDPPPDRTGSLQDALNDNSQLGTLVPMTIEMKAVTVAGTVIYVVGEPVAANHGLQVQLPESSVQTRPVYIPGGGIGEDDNSVLASKLSPTEVGVGVVRNNDGRVTAIRYVDLDRLGLLGDTASLDPGERVKRYESYSVTGFIPATTPEGLRASGTDYPGWVTRDYLQLPDTLPQRVRDKAAEWAGSADNPYDKAIAIQTKLRDYLYDTNIPDTPAGEDNVDYFLFTLGRGYFHYHASAMVVMLRSLGVPARLAVGFAVDDTNRDASGAYVVKDKNSYAWPEVYFPGTGWVPFNPTPDRPADLSPRSDASAPVSRDHNAEDLVPAAVSGFVPPEGEDINPGTSTTPLAGASGSSDQPLAWYISAAVTLFLAALVGAVILGWQRSVAGLPYPQQIWEKTVRLAGWGGIRPQPGQTPHDYARGLGKRFRDVQDDMPVLADAYVKSRFGRKDLSDEEIAAVKDTWPEVRANLVGGIGGRFFRRRKKTG